MRKGDDGRQRLTASYCLASARRRALRICFAVHGCWSSASPWCVLFLYFPHIAMYPILQTAMWCTMATPRTGEIQGAVEQESVRGEVSHVDLLLLTSKARWRAARSTRGGCHTHGPLPSILSLSYNYYVFVPCYIALSSMVIKMLTQFDNGVTDLYMIILGIQIVTSILICCFVSTNNSM